MTCEEALRLLYEVIDKEASQIDTEQVKEHLNGCRHCMARYEFETMFRTFVVEKAASRKKSDELRKRILVRLEDAERNPEITKAKPGQRKYRLFFLSAAALIVFIVAALSIAQMYRHQTVIYPFEKNHLEGNSSEFNGGENAVAVASVADSLAIGYGLRLTDDFLNYNLVQGGFDTIEDHRFIHLYYLMGDAPVSLYIGQDNMQSFRDFKKMVYAGHEYFQHVCARCQVIYWKAGGKIFIAVTANKDAELPILTSAVEPI
jgi:mycothiol system anti-sigma-R factor